MDYTKRQRMTLSKNCYEYADVVNAFKGFLQETESAKLSMLLRHKDTLHIKKIEMEVLTRWKKAYKNRVLARFYKLNDYLKESGTDYTFCTFTTRQDMTLEEQYEFIKAKFRKLRDVMRKEIGKFDYVWVTEAHKTGYAHIHMLAFCIIPDKMQEHYKELWQNKYEAGDKKGMDFSTSADKGQLRSVKNYIMKYISKTLDCLTENAEMLHNAVAWHMSRRSNVNSKGFRFYGMSKNLTSVCSLRGADAGQYYCIKSVYTDSNGNSRVLRELGDMDVLRAGYEALNSEFA